MTHNWRWLGAVPSMNGESLASIYSCSICEQENQVKRKGKEGTIVGLFGDKLPFQTKSDEEYMNHLYPSCKGVFK